MPSRLLQSPYKGLFILKESRSSGPWCRPVSISAPVEDLPFDANLWPSQSSATDLKKAHIENGSSGPRSFGLLYLLLLLLSLGATSSTLHLVSMIPAAMNLHDLMMGFTVLTTSHTLT